jgi:mannose-6-phosphate isomerase-like protein (cupin superfamily)
MPRWETGQVLQAEASYISPSGKTEIRMLPNLESGEVTHATLAPHETSTAAHLDELGEFFYVVSGTGEIWRSDGAQQEVVELRPRRCVSIPAGAFFPYRSKDQPLVFPVAVAPRWSEEHWHAAPISRWGTADATAQPVDGAPHGSGLGDARPAERRRLPGARWL